jgi:hypothetical protein
MEEPIDTLVDWLAMRLGIPATAFTDYAGRPQTMTDHALMLAAMLGLRPPDTADLPLMIEAAASPPGAPIAARRLSPASSRRCGPQRSFCRRRRLSNAPPLPGAPGHASEPQMRCWLVFPRRN